MTLLFLHYDSASSCSEIDYIALLLMNVVTGEGEGR